MEDDLLVDVIRRKEAELERVLFSQVFHFVAHPPISLFSWEWCFFAPIESVCVCLCVFLFVSMIVFLSLTLLAEV